MASLACSLSEAVSEIASQTKRRPRGDKWRVTARSSFLVTCEELFLCHLRGALSLSLRGAERRSSLVLPQSEGKEGDCFARRKSEARHDHPRGETASQTILRPRNDLPGAKSETASEAILRPRSDTFASHCEGRRPEAIRWYFFAVASEAKQSRLLRKRLLRRRNSELAMTCKKVAVTLSFVTARSEATKRSRIFP